MARTIKVGLIDSALSTECSSQFSGYQSAIFNPAVGGDAPLHGSAVCSPWCQMGEHIELYNAVLFDDSLRCQQAHLIAALNWLLTSDVETVHMSLGLRQPSDELVDICQQLVAKGTLLVASAPAQGDAVYPASFFGVISASGDARCQPGQLSQLNPDGASGPQFGGCVFSSLHPLRGASIGAGAVTAELLQQQIRQAKPLSCADAIKLLAAQADYRGREQRDPASTGGVS